MLHISSNVSCDCYATFVSLFNLRHPRDFTSPTLCANVFFWTFARFSPAPAGFSRTLGCGARRGPACTPRRKFGSRAGSVARTLGVQSRETWRVITGLLSAELKPNNQKRVCQLLFSTVVKALYLVAATVQEQSHINLCGLLLCVFGHCICVSVLCAV